MDLPRLVVCTIPNESGGNERTEPADPPILPHQLSHGVGEAAMVSGDSSLELPVGLSTSCLVELQTQQTSSSQSGKQSHRGLYHDQWTHWHDVQEPGQHWEHQPRNNSQGKPSNHLEDSPEAQNHSQKSGRGDRNEEREEVAVVVEPDTSTSEETVVVSPQNTLLTDEAVVGARRSIVLAVGAVEVAWLVDDWQSHAAAGGVGGEQQPVAGDCVEEKEGHEPHSQTVGGACREHDWSYVEDSVDVGQRDHHYSEPHGQSVSRRAREILPQTHRFSFNFSACVERDS